MTATRSYKKFYSSVTLRQLLILITSFYTPAFRAMSPATIHKYLKMFAIVSIFYNSLIAILRITNITNITKSSLGVSVIYHCYLVLRQILELTIRISICSIIHKINYLKSEIIENHKLENL